MKKKYLTTIFILLFFQKGFLYAFDSGFTLQLRAQFGGAYTMPEISEESLKYLNSRATEMAGGMSDLLLGADAEVGYTFRSHEYFELSEDAFFSGLGAFVYLGFSQGNTSQRITAVENEQDFDIYMSVNFLPIINFGLTGKTYFADNKLAVGLSAGGRLIADITPEYLCYSSDPDIIPTEVGTVIISADMIRGVNPLMFSTKMDMEYNVIILPTTEMVLSAYAQYSFFRPNHLTIPPSLLAMAVGDNPDFDINREFPDYWLNGLDIGVNIGLAFRI